MSAQRSVIMGCLFLGVALPIGQFSLGLATSDTRACRRVLPAGCSCNPDRSLPISMSILASLQKVCCRGVAANAGC